MKTFSLKQNEFTFEIFLRKGFDNLNYAETASSFNALNQGHKLTTYRLDLPFSKLLKEILKAETPFIIFADDVVGLSFSEIQELEECLKINGDIAGATFVTNALETVYGLHFNKTATKGVTKKPQAIQMAPSWFSVLNMEFLKKSGLLECKYQTLEYFLFEISYSISKSSKHFILLDSVNIEIDSRLWIRDIILMNSPSLASDYAISKQMNVKNERHLEIPSQFKIEISGEYASLPLDEHNVSLYNNSSNPKFSVICPAYKSRFFEETVSSVLKQTWENWELIVIIDGPPEDEKETLKSILKKYSSDPRIKFYCQENKGTGPTRRRLAKMAEGDFIITIDDDDMFLPDVLNIFALAIRHYPDGVVFRGGAQLFGLVDLYLSPRQRTIINDMSCDLFEATQPFIIDRKVLTTLGGFEGDRSFREAGEDSDLFFKIDKAKLKTYLIDRPMYFRRISTANQTLSLRPDECMDHISNLINRHCLSGWKFSDIHFQKDGEFIKATIVYQDGESEQKVVTATRFFDYQTLGESNHVLIDLEITSACNSVCAFCPREDIKRNEKFISMDLINILAEQISRETGARQVILCGIGESTLHPKLEDIVDILSKAGAKVCMTTNGSLMNVDKFKQLADSGMVEFNFSLNANTTETHRHVMKMHNFKSIQSNLSAILDYKKKAYHAIDINVSFVLCKQNQHEVFDFVEEWRNTGVSKIWIHPVNHRAGLLSKDVNTVDISRIAERFAGDDMVIVDIFKHLPDDGDVCKIAQLLDFISVDGDMLLCALDYTRSSLIGNLKDTTLQQMHLTKFLKYKQKDIKDICHSCDFLPKLPD
ncbi:MAG: glycosyltransferase [Planctomycetota bacterium]|jgi:MoaA/NifB/PqqE/SkfB family radical SAM enzyme/glycosyltransferase involved in cell wall biosynthesis